MLDSHRSKGRDVRQAVAVVLSTHNEQLSIDDERWQLLRSNFDEDV